MTGASAGPAAAGPVAARPGGRVRRGMPVTSPGGWGLRWAPADDARLRLFCLPHAGGGAATFRSWAGALGPDVDVVAVRLPGREARLREAPRERLEQVVPDLLQDLRPWLDRPSAWFGHSLGGLLAFEACRALRRLREPEASALVVAATRAPHLPARSSPVHDAPEPALLARLRHLDGSAEEVLHDRAVVRTVLPAIRADFAVAETYRCRDEPPLACPITAFGGTGDDFADGEDLRAWQRHTTRPLRHRVVSGGHFFPHRPRDRFVQLLRDELREVGLLG